MLLVFASGDWWMCCWGTVLGPGEEGFRGLVGVFGDVGAIQRWVGVLLVFAVDGSGRGVGALQKLRNAGLIIYLQFIVHYLYTTNK